MDEHGHIRTQFDDLIDGIKKGNGKPVSVHVLAAASGLSAKDVRKWVEILEKDGKVRMHNSIDAIYVSWVDTSASPFEPGFAPRAETKLEVATPVDVDTLAISQGRGPASENDILIAQHHEERAKIAKPVSPGEAHQNVDADSDVVDKNGQMHKIDSLISSYRKNAQVEPAIRPQAPAKASAKEADELLSRIEMDISKPEEAGRLEEEEPEFSIPSNAYDSEEPRFTAEKIQLPKPEIRKAERLQPSIEKIEAQGPVRIAGVPVQFSERLAKHLKRIEAQTEKIKALRGEKEKLLNEQYVPIQRKLESELETVGDRILQMEKNIMEMQKRAIGIPEKIGAVDKMHMSTLKAHDEIRRAYDEASALIEESNGVLSNERDKIESILEKGRQEIAQHRAKTNELQSTLQRISEMEEESANKVVIAREALADQATQLAAAEKYSSDLRSLKTEISGQHQRPQGLRFRHKERAWRHREADGPDEADRVMVRFHPRGLQQEDRRARRVHPRRQPRVRDSSRVGGVQFRPQVPQGAEVDHQQLRVRVQRGQADRKGPGPEDRRGEGEAGGAVRGGQEDLAHLRIAGKRP